MQHDDGDMLHCNRLQVWTVSAYSLGVHVLSQDKRFHALDVFCSLGEHKSSMETI